MGYATTFLRSQLFTKLPYPNSSFAGQTVIVTGSNTGLGLEAARHIARLGAAKVILACRTVTKGQTAAADITASEHLTSDRIEVWELNLSSYQSIKAFAQRVQRLDRLDAFIQSGDLGEEDPVKPALLMFSAFNDPQFRSIRLRSRRSDCAACSSQAGRLLLSERTITRLQPSQL